MAESESAFRAFLRSRNLDLSTITVAQALSAWIDFFKAQRFDDVVEGMDWLWFQFGTYDWGAGPSYQLDLTRQFILKNETDDDAIWQLSLVLHFPPSSAFYSGLEDCKDPAAADAFEERLLVHDAVTRVAGIAPDRAELILENAG